jgi:hypothetical protein
MFARSFDEFLADAPRTLLDQSSEGVWALDWCARAATQNHKLHSCVAENHAQEFDADSTGVLNRLVPLDLLVEAAKSASLPENLRQEVALAAWVRSVIFEDAESAASLSPQLPESIRATAGTSIGFPAVLAILRNPGLRPYVEPGVSRLATYDYLEEFRDNWWCHDWETQYYHEQQKSGAPAIKPVAFLSARQQETAAAQYQRLMQLPCGPTYLGRRVIVYAKAHPEAPDVPEALALTVRATHFGWREENGEEEGKTENNTAVSKAAFQLLHSRYPKSPWTSRTPYYY